jgi:hypothetical protein
MPLNATQARTADVGRHSDGRGLYLLVKPTAEWARIKKKQDGGETLAATERQIFLAKPAGAKSWVLRVQHSGTRRDFGIGGYTDSSISKDYDRYPLEARKALTLEEARKKAALGRELARMGHNPSTIWRQDEPQEVRTFKAVADEYHKQAKKGCCRSGSRRARQRGA